MTGELEQPKNANDGEELKNVSILHVLHCIALLVVNVPLLVIHRSIGGSGGGASPFGESEQNHTDHGN